MRKPIHFRVFDNDADFVRWQRENHNCKITSVTPVMKTAYHNEQQIAIETKEGNVDYNFQAFVTYINKLDRDIG